MVLQQFEETKQRKWEKHTQTDWLSDSNAEMYSAKHYVWLKCMTLLDETRRKWKQYKWKTKKMCILFIVCI